MWVDVTVNGSGCDEQIFNELQPRPGIIHGTLQVPATESLPGDELPMPYFLIGDDAFSLHMWLMKPFSGCGLIDDQRIVNY